MKSKLEDGLCRIRARTCRWSRAGGRARRPSSHRRGRVSFIVLTVRRNDGSDSLTDPSVPTAFSRRVPYSGTRSGLRRWRRTGVRGRWRDRDTRDRPLSTDGCLRGEEQGCRSPCHTSIGPPITFRNPEPVHDVEFDDAGSIRLSLQKTRKTPWRSTARCGKTDTVTGPSESCRSKRAARNSRTSLIGVDGFVLEAPTSREVVAWPIATSSDRGPMSSPISRR